jgi:hypothetical protein
MRIRVTDPVGLSELLRYLRARGCIAYVVSEQLDTLEVLLPHVFGRQESETIAELVALWQAEHRDVRVETLPEREQ